MNASSTGPSVAADDTAARSSVRRQMAAAARRIQRLERVDRAAVDDHHARRDRRRRQRNRDPGVHRGGGGAAFPSRCGRSLTQFGWKTGRRPPDPRRSASTNRDGADVYDVAADGSLAFYRSTDGQQTRAPLQVRSEHGGDERVALPDGGFNRPRDRRRPRGVDAGDLRAEVPKARPSRTSEIQVAERGMVQIDRAARPVCASSYVQDGDRRIVAGQVLTMPST